jgi:hypothetical protein
MNYPRGGCPRVPEKGCSDQTAGEAPGTLTGDREKRLQRMTSSEERFHHVGCLRHFSTL